MTRIGFIGLGNMGAPMAKRLLDAGHPLVVFDVRKETVALLEGANVIVASSPQDVASQAEIVLASLPTPEIVRAVALGENGVIHGSKARIYVDMSTTGPKFAKEIGDVLREAGITAIDAPVSGGTAGAVAGTLALMVSGATGAVNEVLPVLRAIGKPIVVGAEVGMGQSLKLINNLMAANHLAITAEAMVLGVKAGLDPDTMLEVLNAGSARNSASADRFPAHVLTRKFANGFANSLMRKDLRLAMEMAETLQVPLWVSTAVDRLWMQTCLQIGGDENTTSIVKMIEQWAGVEVRGKAAGPVRASP